MIRRVTGLQLALDGVLALVLLLFLGAPSIALTVAEGEWPYTVVATLVLAAVVTTRRLAPVPGLLVALALGIVFVALQLTALSPVWLEVLVPLYAVGRYGGTWHRVLGAVVAVLGAAVVALWFARTAWDPVNVLVAFGAVGVAALLLFGSPLLVGLLVDVIVGSQRLARERREETERAEVEQERAGIARDMHDVVAHSLAVVIAQANGARYASDTSQKDESLSQIASTASSALGDVRALLQRLRHEQAADPDASIMHVERLVDQVRAAGLQVRLVESGPRVLLPRSTDIAAYRIVQEALTNALRHGDRTHAAIVEIARGASLEITVRNGIDRMPGEPGHGLVGMRERARIAGGTCTASLTGTTFTVRATLPVLQEATP